MMMERCDGRLDAICVSVAKGTRKTEVPTAMLVDNHGLDGDAHAGPWHRQVSLLGAGDIAEMQTLMDGGLTAGDFAENLVVSGLDLPRFGLGTRLSLGNAVELRVTQRGKVCHQRCVIYHQTGRCIMPTRGIFARVVRGGQLRAGDPVRVAELVAPEVLQVVVLTISDKGARGAREDTAGPAVAEVARGRMGAHIYATEILPDERDQIEERLRHYAGGHGIDLVVAVGGTGFSPRDVTPEAVRAVAQRLTPGLDEAMRSASLQKTPHASLSRSVSGICGRTLIVSLPGSKRAATENLAVIAAALPHGIAKLRGDRSDCGS